MGNYGKPVDANLDFSEKWVEFTPEEIEKWNQRGLLPHDCDGRLQYESTPDEKAIEVGQSLDVCMVGDIPWSRILFSQIDDSRDGRQCFSGMVYLVFRENPIPCVGVHDPASGRGWLLDNSPTVEKSPDQYN